MPRHATSGDEVVRKSRASQAPRGQLSRASGAGSGSPQHSRTPTAGSDSPQQSGSPTAGRSSHERQVAGLFTACSSIRSSGSECGSVSRSNSNDLPKVSRRDVDLQTSAPIPHGAQDLPAGIRLQAEPRTRSPRLAKESIGSASNRSISDVSATSSRASSEKDLSRAFNVTKGPPGLPLAPQSRTPSSTGAVSRTTSLSKQEPQPWPTPPSPGLNIPSASSVSFSKSKPPLSSSPMAKHLSNSPRAGTGSGITPRKPSASSVTGTPATPHQRLAGNPSTLSLASANSASSLRGLRRARGDSTASLASSDLRSFPIDLDDACENGGHLLPVEARCSHRNCRCHTGCSSAECRICLQNTDGAEAGPGAESAGLVTPMERLRMVSSDVPSPKASASRRGKSVTPRKLFPNGEE